MCTNVIWYLHTVLDFAGASPAHMVCIDNAEKYGNIFSLRLGQRWTVVLNGADVIKEALLKKGVEFANRPNSFSCKYALIQKISETSFI